MTYAARHQPCQSNLRNRTLCRAVAAGVFLLCGVIGCRANEKGRQTGDSSIDDAPRGTSIVDGWRFLRADDSRASTPAFDDATWERISLPHTWNVLDGSDGGNNYYRGRAWYRRGLNIDGSALKRGKRFFLRFGGAALVADVYVNGTHVGEHRGGYAAFCYDVTEQLRAGPNSLCVRVNNARMPDIAPQSGDFTIFGGLYRDVALLVLDPLHISPIDDASSGVYIKPVEVKAAKATVEFVTKVRNDTEAEQKGTLHVKLAGNAGSAAAAFAIPANTDADVVSRIDIDKPNLWDGVRNPALYRANVSIVDDTGQVRDALDQSFGLRTVDFDPEQGLLLNGKRYAMHGVDTHQEVGGKGSAASGDDYAQIYQLIRDMGATTVRMAHYQHNDYEYTLCDRSGMLVWAEVPMVNAFGASPDFATNLQQQLRELIKQNYNHPSIVIWSLLNEVGLDEKDPKWNIIRDCNALAKRLDPSRHTAIAEHTSPRHGALKIPDVIAFNRYTGWYSGDADDFGKTIDGDRAANPERAIAISEYGAGGSIDQHELNPAPVNPGGPWHPEEYQSYVHERNWAAIQRRPNLWASYIWNMFDFSADHRNEGDHPGRNDKGLITFDQRTPKDAYYFYQSQWTTRPMVHITSKRFDPYPVGRSDVKVYSNCDTVELLQNGRSLGTQKASDGVFVFKDVEFDAGKMTTVARGFKDATHVEDRIVRNASTSSARRTTPSTAPSTGTTATTTATK